MQKKWENQTSKLNPVEKFLSKDHKSFTITKYLDLM